MREGVLVLAHYTGWQLSEIDEMSVEELFEWLGIVPKDNANGS